MREFRDTRKEDAKRLLRDREHAVDVGAAASPRATKITFDDAAADLITDYETNKRRSLRTVRLRLRKHLTPYFQHRRLATITTVDVRAYTARRQAAGASNATINRELIVLKRMCTLVMQAGKLMVRPYIPLLKENNVRKGFFEPEQFTSVKQHLPAYMRAVVESRVHYRVAHTERDPAARMAPSRPKRSRGAARRRNHQERRRSRVSDHEDPSQGSPRAAGGRRVAARSGHDCALRVLLHRRCKGRAANHRERLQQSVAQGANGGWLPWTDSTRLPADGSPQLGACGCARTRGHANEWS